MEEIYLDQTKKSYYLKDFNENVLTEIDPFWKLCETIKPHLIELNSLDNIQPIFSKYPDNRNSLSRNESYLTFAYSKDIELHLYREILPFFIVRFNNLGESKFYYAFSEPKDNILYSDEPSEFKQGCLTNPDYFRINQIRLSFECVTKATHDIFWTELVKNLKEIE